MTLYEDLGYQVEFKAENHFISFKVYEIDSEEVFMEGYVKWDGCSNWNFPHKHYPLHFCKTENADRFNQLIHRMYGTAKELLGDKWLK